MYWKPGSWQPGEANEPKKAGQLQCWLTQRNESLMAHGTTPAKEKTVRFLLEAYDNLVKDFVPNLKQLKDDATLIKL